MSVPNLTQESLNTSIKTTFDDPLSAQIKWAIIDRLLGEQCNQALHDGGRHISARTHHDIVETWQYFKNGVPREDIIRILKAKLPAHRQASNGINLANGTIDLAARLCLMMDVGELKYGFTGRQQKVWTTGSLSEFLTQSFQLSSRQRGADNTPLATADLEIFIFPTGLIEETIRSIALLIPQNDKDCGRWFKKVSVSEGLDRKAIRCGRLQAEDRRIEKFKFWGERLAILKEVFDEAQPGTMPQWWCDRRKRVQWYTFWVAIWVLVLTVVFGIIQSVEGALQVYKPFQPSS